MLQELAHLYHYYLHGEQGNRAAGGSKAMREGRLPNGEPFPDIVLQYQVGGCSTTSITAFSLPFGVARALRLLACCLTVGICY